MRVLPAAIAGTYSIIAEGQGATGYNSGGVLVDYLVLERTPCVVNFNICRNVLTRNVVNLTTLVSVGSPYYFEADFGDGTGWQALSSSLTHTYTAAGSYSICVRQMKQRGLHLSVQDVSMFVSSR